MPEEGRGDFALTDRARKVVGVAWRIVRQRGARFVDTEHLLLALLKPGSGVALEALRRMGLKVEAVVGAIDRLDPPQPGIPGEGGLLLTRSAEKALRLAEEAARQFGHRMVGTEHLLLGLMEEESGVAAAVLAAAGLRAEAFRRLLLERILEGLEGRFGPPEGRRGGDSTPGFPRFPGRRG